VSDNLQSMTILQTDNPRLLRRLEQEVHVWLTRPEDVTNPDKSQEYLSLLSLEERQRYRQFRFDGDRHHFLVAHALLRRVLSAYVDVDPSNWQFSSNQHGRPEISAPKIAPSLRFNLTHTAGLVACVVALELDCGIDVEQLSARGNLTGIAEKMFAASERQALNRLDGDALLGAFFSYWTLHEAYCKALGVGIAHSKRNYRFLPESDGQWTIDFDAPSDGESHHWQFALMKPTTQHLVALAIHTAAAANKAIIHSFVVP
jgi:4'-phosphopantetheinyl transferase